MEVDSQYDTYVTIQNDTLSTLFGQLITKLPTAGEKEKDLLAALWGEKVDTNQAMDANQANRIAEYLQRKFKQLLKYLDGTGSKPPPGWQAFATAAKGVALEPKQRVQGPQQSVDEGARKRNRNEEAGDAALATVAPPPRRRRLGSIRHMGIPSARLAVGLTVAHALAVHCGHARGDFEFTLAASELVVVEPGVPLMPATPQDSSLMLTATSLLMTACLRIGPLMRPLHLLFS